MSDGAMNLLPVAKTCRFHRRHGRRSAPGGLALMRTHLYAAPEFASPLRSFPGSFATAAASRCSAPRAPTLTCCGWTRKPRREFQRCTAATARAVLGGEMLEGHFQAYESLLTYYRMTLYYAMRAHSRRPARNISTSNNTARRDYSPRNSTPFTALRKR